MILLTKSRILKIKFSFHKSQTFSYLLLFFFFFFFFFWFLNIFTFSLEPFLNYKINFFKLTEIIKNIFWVIIGVCRTPMWSTRPVFRNPNFEQYESQRIAINLDVTSWGWVFASWHCDVTQRWVFALWCCDVTWRRVFAVVSD